MRVNINKILNEEENLIHAWDREITRYIFDKKDINDHDILSLAINDNNVKILNASMTNITNIIIKINLLNDLTSRA